MKLGSICNREVIVALKEETAANAITLMREHHVGELVIVEGVGSHVVPVGVLTDRDILISVINANLNPSDILIADIISYNLVTARFDSSIENGLKIMRTRGVRRLPVVGRNNELVGLVTLDDIVDLVSAKINDLAVLIHTEKQQEVRRNEWPDYSVL